MADEKTELTWVEQPSIVDGHVSYAYRNSGTAAAVFVSEFINVLPTDGSPNSVQSYQLEHLDIDAEQRTHAPVSSDHTDGAVQVLVSIQASSDQKEWDATIEGEIAGVFAGGVLYPAGAAPEAAGNLAVDIASFELQGSEAVVHYRVTGDLAVQMLTGSIALSKGDDTPAWMTALSLERDLEDIARVAVPLDDIVDESEGWKLRVTVAASTTQEGIGAYREGVLLVRKVDGSVTADPFSPDQS
jgi:hypothetical protein